MVGNYGGASVRDCVKSLPQLRSTAAVKAEAPLPHSRKASNGRPSYGGRERSCRFVHGERPVQGVFTQPGTREPGGRQAAKSDYPGTTLSDGSFLASHRGTFLIGVCNKAAREYARPTFSTFSPFSTRSLKS